MRIVDFRFSQQKKPLNSFPLVISSKIAFSI